NTGQGDRPDSDANGKLPGTYLAYPPSNTFADAWNKLSSYDNGSTCPAFSNTFAGQWKLTLSKDNTHSVTLNVFTVDTTAPTVTSINRGSGATNPTNGSSATFRVTFSEAVSGVSAGKFSVTSTGTIAGASVGTVTQ